MYGATPFEQGQIDQFIDLAAHEIDLPAAVWVYPIQGKVAYNKAVTEKAKADITAVLTMLNQHLASRTFLVGEAVTLADIVVFASLLDLFKLVVDREFRKAFGHVVRWFTTVAEQPHVRAVVGLAALAETAAQPVAPAKGAQQEKAAKPKAEPKPKPEAKPKKEAPKKEEPKPAATEDAEPKKKAPNPLDLLPPPKIDMDTWKRLYSNNTKEDAYRQLWEQYSPEDYCIFFCTYKYNEECRVLFMTNNMIRGFFQRLERLHKYGFGTMLVMGEAPNLKVAGCWMFRGKDIPAEMLACDDSEYYTWTRADPSNPADRAKIEGFWAGKVEGETVDEDWSVFK